MTLDSFAKATVDVIRAGGMVEYLPTLVLAETYEIRVIEGIPVDVDHRVAVQNVIRRSGYGSSEFFFGVRSKPEEITIGHYLPGQPTEFMIIAESPGGYSAIPLETCEWWNLT